MLQFFQENKRIFLGHGFPSTLTAFLSHVTNCLTQAVPQFEELAILA